MKNVICILVFFTAVLLFTGCGGGTGSDPETSTETEERFSSALAIDANDTLSNQIISVDKPYVRYVFENATKDKDYYLRVVPSDANPNESHNRQLNIDISDKDGLIDTRHYVVTGDTATIQVNHTTESALYFEISGQDDAEQYRYDISLYPGLSEGLEQDVLTHELNDHQKIAYPMAFDTLYSSRVTLTEDKTDWFVLKGLSGGKDYYFEITSSEDNPSGITVRNLYLQYYDEQGAISNLLVAYSGAGYTNQIISAVDGDVAVKLYGANTGYTYKYTLKAYPGFSGGLEQNSTTYEPNNYREIAYPMAFDTNMTSEVYGTHMEVDTPKYAGHIDRLDWFSISGATAGQTYNIDICTPVDAPSGLTSENLYIQAYDELGAIGNNNVVKYNECKTFPVTPSVNGKLYFSLTGYYTQYLYKYSFKVSPAL